MKTQTQVNAAKKTMAVGGVAGLTLRVTATGHKSYVLRTNLNGKATWLPVCGFEVSLAKARAIAEKMLVKKQANPDEVAREHAESRIKYTVEELMLDYIQSEEDRGRWTTSGRQPHGVKFRALIQNHFTKALRELPVARLTPERIASEFGELWKNARATPDKCIGELRRAWDWGIAMKKVPTSMSNPASTNVLKHLLVAPAKRVAKTHFPYLPPERIPEFVACLSKMPGCAPSCLLFSMLTAARHATVLTLKWKQVDFEKETVTIPRAQMKVKDLTFDRVTPLSKQAVAILNAMPKGEPDDFVFYHWQGADHCALSETSLAQAIRRLNAGMDVPFKDPKEIDNEGKPRNPTPHGLSRTSFTIWANSAVTYKHRVFDRDIVDACLDHLNDKYGGAYMREYPLQDMRVVLQAWADYCFSSRPTRR